MGNSVSKKVRTKNRTNYWRAKRRAAYNEYQALYMRLRRAKKAEDPERIAMCQVDLLLFKERQAHLRAKKKRSLYVS
jgi:hypothetical protein